MDEIWKPIKYGKIKLNMYEASNLGRIRNCMSGHIMSQCPSEKGYMMCIFRCIDNKSRSIKIHRIIASIFVNGYTELNNEVNHIDGNKNNNKSTNLEWISHIANIHHAYKHDLVKINHGSLNGMSILTEYDAEMISKYLAYYCGNSSQTYYAIKRKNPNTIIRLCHIYDIKRKRIWTRISDKYFDIKSINKIKELSESDIILICETLIKYSNDLDASYYDLLDNKSYITKNMIRCIRDGIYYRSITKKYFK